MESIRATYRIRDAADPARRAEELALEQTVELPREALVGRAAERGLRARVTAVEPVDEDSHWARLEIPLEAAAGDPAQLLNVLFGNVSLQGDVELVDVDLPDSLLEDLGGPGFGIRGLREACGVEGRALSCVALKPMGLPPEDLADLCRTLAVAGIDLIKDDHGLADAPGCPLAARVAACVGALDRATDETGRRAVYAPNLIGTPSALARQLDAAAGGGAGAVMAAPLVIGLPAFLELARASPVPVLAHPALGGGRGFATGLLLGTIFRLYGADAVIFPHAGGRFPFDLETCGDLAARLGGPLGGLRPALPVPAGGMSVARVREMVEFYGIDVMLLVGGSLYVARQGLAERAREFVARVRDAVVPEGPRGRAVGAGE
ncbi:MAG: RuBisCO large subunit C-terminal-like domain-containing protein [Gemmatimonadota bacterium]